TGGRLSEVLGPATLRVDRRFVALGLRRAAAAEWQVLAPHVRTALERYAEGVNAGIREMGRWNRPPEFLLLGITPEPWTPVDSLSVARLLAWRLAENRWGELLRGRLAKVVGPIEAARLMNAWPPNAPPILREAPVPAPPQTTASQASPVAGGAALEARAVARALPAPLPPGLEWLGVTVRPGGSNSWVVSGARTATGRPLLANDPHLAIEMPATWYEVHVVAAGLDVAGVTLPAAPFVIIGHNARIAWGLTNTGVDVQDLYIEDVDMTRRRYLHRGQWLPLESTVYEIGVRGQERPERWEVFRTRHGPLVFTETEWRSE